MGRTLTARLRKGSVFAEVAITVLGVDGFRSKVRRAIVSVGPRFMPPVDTLTSGLDFVSPCGNSVSVDHGCFVERWRKQEILSAVTRTMYMVLNHIYSRVPP